MYKYTLTNANTHTHTHTHTPHKHTHPEIVSGDGARGYLMVVSGHDVGLLPGLLTMGPPSFARAAGDL
jgi:hypothetical protein